MGLETKVLNLYLYQKPEGTKHRVWMAYNFTTKPVSSWDESLLYKSTNGGVSVNLGLNYEPEKIAELIRKKLEEIHFFSLITEIHLHNEGDYEGGEKDKLPEQLYYQIHDILWSKELKIDLEPKVYLVPSRN